MEREDWDGDDDLRPLTEEGIVRMREAAQGLTRMGLDASVILTSPLTRARQTADILAKELNLGKPKLLECLACGATPLAVMDALTDEKSEAPMLVGHEPDMGHMASFFLGLARPVPFKKGAVMAIEFENHAGQGKGRLLWYMPTKVMKNLR